MAPAALKQLLKKRNKHASDIPPALSGAEWMAPTPAPAPAPTPPPPVQVAPPPRPVGDPPKTFAQLADISDEVVASSWDASMPLKLWLRSLQQLAIEGKVYYTEGNYDMAFVRTATVLKLQRDVLPYHHPEWRSLPPEQVVELQRQSAASAQTYASLKAFLQQRTAAYYDLYHPTTSTPSAQSSSSAPALTLRNTVTAAVTSYTDSTASAAPSSASSSTTNSLRRPPADGEAQPRRHPGGTPLPAVPKQNRLRKAFGMGIGGGGHKREGSAGSATGSAESASSPGGVWEKGAEGRGRGRNHLPEPGAEEKEGEEREWELVGRAPSAGPAYPPHLAPHPHPHPHSQHHHQAQSSLGGEMPLPGEDGSDEEGSSVEDEGIAYGGAGGGSQQTPTWSHLNSHGGGPAYPPHLAHAPSPQAQLHPQQYTYPSPHPPYEHQQQPYAAQAGRQAISPTAYGAIPPVPVGFSPPPHQAYSAPPHPTPPTGYPPQQPHSSPHPHLQGGFSPYPPPQAQYPTPSAPPPSAPAYAPTHPLPPPQTSHLTAAIPPLQLPSVPPPPPSFPTRPPAPSAPPATPTPPPPPPAAPNAAIVPKVGLGRSPSLSLGVVPASLLGSRGSASPTSPGGDSRGLGSIGELRDALPGEEEKEGKKKEEIPPVPEEETVFATTESGAPLRPLLLPASLPAYFMNVIAASNTEKGVETCGLLLGRLARNTLTVTHLLIPKQVGTSDTCETTSEEEQFAFQEREGLLTLGWIHTHPTQSCFLSSRDLHTCTGYQLMLAEAVAVVCAPRFEPSVGVFRLTDPPGLKVVAQCTASGTFHEHPDLPLYTDVDSDEWGHCRMVFEEDQPGGRFECVDLR